ncbi:MAG: hypothetical protein AAGE52_37050 [Myxococcota bacterium]
MRKLIVYGAVAIVAIGGVAAVADALVVTDEERLESFADSFAGEVSTRRIDHALGYFDPDREAVSVSSYDDQWEFASGEGADLATEVRAILRDFQGEDVDMLQRSITHDDQDARVALRLRNSEGVFDATFDLRKHGERWLVRRARVR